MVVFKSNVIKNGYNTYDFGSNGKHLMMSMGCLGNLTVCLYYDNPEKSLELSESFLIEKESQEVHNLFDGMFFSYGGKVFFDAEGAGLTLTKEKEGYRFNFDRTFEESNGIIESRLATRTQENESLNNLFTRLQGLNPDTFEQKVREGTTIPKKLQKNQKNIES